MAFPMRGEDVGGARSFDGRGFLGSSANFVGASGNPVAGLSDGVNDGTAIDATASTLLPAARLLEEAMAQDELCIRTDEACPPGASADYDCGGPSAFDVLHVAACPPTALLSAPSGPWTATARAGVRQGVLPEIQRVWRAFGSQLVLWKYTDPRAPDVMTYEGVTQQIVIAAIARPKEFVAGVAYFLVLSTPVEVSLHVVRFAPNSDRMLPLLRTQHVVATDDVAASAIASDDTTGRIFLGGVDGCVHELNYFADEDSTWLGLPKRSRRSVVHRNVQSRFPAVLQKVGRALFGAPDGVAHLVCDGSRGLLFSLSTQSAVMMYAIPPSRRDASGRLEEPPLQLICSVSVHQLASEVARARTQLFPGLAPPRLHLFGAGGLAAAATALAGPKLRLVRLLPLDRSQGGDVVLCAVVEDGTRILLRGVTKQSRRYPAFAGAGGSQGQGLGPGAAGAMNPWSGQQTLGGSYGTSGASVAPMSQQAGAVGIGGVSTIGSGTSSGGRGLENQDGRMVGLAVHHVRFLDGSLPSICVRDAIHSEGVTMLLGQAGAQLSAQSWSAGGPFGGSGRGGWGIDSVGVLPAQLDGDVVIAISSDLRSVAQRQSRGRSPWLVPPQGAAECVEVLRLDSTGSCACQAVVLAAFSCQLARPLEFLYSRGGACQPVLRLGELARQQLMPPARFLLVSNLGVHTFTKRRPLEDLQQRIVAGDLTLLRDFATEYTAEQTCALLFQILATAMVGGTSNPAANGAFGNDSLALQRGRPLTLASATRCPTSFGTTSWQQQQLNPMVAHSMGCGSFGPGFSFGMPSSSFRREAGAFAPEFLEGAGGAVAAAAEFARPRVVDQVEELTVLRAEHLLLHPQLASQLGFLQSWTCAEAHGLEPLPSALGHSIHSVGAQRISGRLRGLYLYLSRILRPFWLAPIMEVAWPVRPDANKGKRRRDDWWPPPPEPVPVVQGSQWRCNWSRDQRGYVQQLLVGVLALVQRCSLQLATEGPPPAASQQAPLYRQGIFAPSLGASSDFTIVEWLGSLVATSIEALAFLELVAVRTDALATAPMSPQTLLRLAELTFRDLVCLPEARQVLQQLMRAGVVSCRQLHLSCPRLFSGVDLELQEACELLLFVQQGLLAARSVNTSANGYLSVDYVRLSHLVQRALSSLQRHAGLLDLAEVAPRLRAVGAFRGLIGLCVRVARARDPRDESLRPLDATSARAQQVHYARLECYQMVLELFEELLSGVRRQQAIAGETPALLGIEGGAPLGELTPAGSRARLPELLPVPVDPASAATLLDSFLRHCLEDEAYLADEMFHFCIFKWMTQHRLPVYRYDSPYLAGFLETRCSDQPELLCHYYQHRGRWADACDAYLALARGAAPATVAAAAAAGTRLPRSAEPTLSEQIGLLQSAALCAQMPGSGRRAEPIRRALAQLSRLQSGAVPLEDSTTLDGGGVGGRGVARLGDSTASSALVATPRNLRPGSRTGENKVSGDRGNKLSLGIFSNGAEASKGEEETRPLTSSRHRLYR